MVSGLGLIGLCLELFFVRLFGFMMQGAGLRVADLGFRGVDSAHED